MKANELRIGNYFIGYSNNLQQWELASFGLLIEGIEVDEIIRGFVPLTEEWLLKFGFEKELGWDNMVYFNNNGMHIYLRENSKESWLEYENDIVLKSVHQFQNLYFALTNKELL